MNELEKQLSLLEKSNKILGGFSFDYEKPESNFPPFGFITHGEFGHSENGVLRKWPLANMTFILRRAKQLKTTYIQDKGSVYDPHGKDSVLITCVALPNYGNEKTILFSSFLLRSAMTQIMAKYINSIDNIILHTAANQIELQVVRDNKVDINVDVDAKKHKDLRSLCATIAGFSFDVGEKVSGKGVKYNVPKNFKMTRIDTGFLGEIEIAYKNYQHSFEDIEYSALKYMNYKGV